MATPIRRTDDGQRVKKMLKIATNGVYGKRNVQEVGSMWQRCVENISGQLFSALEKSQNSGKYVKISLRNDNKSIHDSYPIQLGQILRQYLRLRIED